MAQFPTEAGNSKHPPGPVILHVGVIVRFIVDLNAAAGRQIDLGQIAQAIVLIRRCFILDRIRVSYGVQLFVRSSRYLGAPTINHEGLVINFGFRAVCFGYRGFIGKVIGILFAPLIVRVGKTNRKQGQLSPTDLTFWGNFLRIRQIAANLIFGCRRVGKVYRLNRYRFGCTPLQIGQREDLDSVQLSQCGS